MNIKEINNLKGANKLGPSLKRRKETVGKKGPPHTICIKLQIQGNTGLISMSFLHDKELLH